MNRVQNQFITTGFFLVLLISISQLVSSVKAQFAIKKNLNDAEKCDPNS